MTCCNSWRCHTLATAIALTFAIVASAQAASVNSPGGLGLSNVTMWLDASKIDITDTTNEVRLSGSDVFVKRWDSQVGINHAAQAVLAKQPQYMASGPNGKPYVYFDGAATTALTDRLTMPNSTTLGTAYIVAQWAAGTTFSLGASPSDNYANLLSSTPDADNKWQFLGNANGNTWYSSTFSTFNNYSTNGTATSNIASVSPINNYNFYGGTDSTLPTIPNLHIGEEVPGDFGGNRPWIGGVPEVITYNNVLNSTAQKLVENYLSSKYARPFGSLANDHYSGEASGYDEEVFGIGNDGTSSILSSGMQGIDLTASSLDGGDWLLAGNDGTAFGLSADTDNRPEYISQRWNRVWFLDKTGVLDATIAFDFEDAGLTLPGPGATFQVLYSADSNFSDGFQILAQTNSISSGTVTFNLSDAMLLDGYYTLNLLTMVPEPNSMLLVLGALGCGVLHRRKHRQLLMKQGWYAS